MNSASGKPKVFALSLAALAWFGVLLQCYLSLQFASRNGKSMGSGLAVFLSYFTVLTNLLICVSLTFSSMASSASSASSGSPTSSGSSTSSDKWFSRPSVVAGIATSITFVGLSYHFLLRHTWNPQGAQLLADVLLHYVIPALYVLYWWFVSSKAALRWTHPLFWSLYPTVYLVYALIRGSIQGSYPYPFIDVAKLGYGRTMLNSLALLFAFLALGLLFVALGRARQSTHR
jgi:hypothetical protein